MGRPDQGNKAQTPVGYSHGTGVSIDGPVTVVTRVLPRVTPGTAGSPRRWLGWTDGARSCNAASVAVSWMGNDRRLAPRSARVDRRAARGPRERQGGDAGGRVVVLQTVWSG